MAEQLLHVADVGAGVQAVVRERVAQPVRAGAAQVGGRVRVGERQLVDGPRKNPRGRPPDHVGVNGSPVTRWAISGVSAGAVLSVSGTGRARSASINRRGIGTVRARRPLPITFRLQASLSAPSSAVRVSAPVVAAASSTRRSPVA